MSSRVNQFAVYRLKRGLKETRVLRNQSFSYLEQNGLEVNSDYYEQAYLSSFDPSLTPQELRKKLEDDLPHDVTGKALKTGDILAITKDGIAKAYYIDPDRLVPLSGFFHVAASSTILTTKTTGYVIEGRQGVWSATEEMWIDGQNFLLMQSEEFGADTAYAVVDSHGKKAADDTMDGFSDKVIEQIREYIHGKKKSDTPTPESERSEPDQNLSTEEPAKKEPVNTEDELPKVVKTDTNSAESSDDIHGQNQIADKKEQEARRRRKRRRKNGKLPLKGRDSVLERLKRYQEELARKKTGAK